MAVKTPVLESHININIIIKVNLRKIMNKLNKILVLAMFSMASLVSNVSADSSIFAGPYVGVTASMAGVEMDGKYEDPDQGVNTKDTGQTGMVGTFGSIQAGYSITNASMGFVTAGISYTPTGDATFAAKDIGAENVNFTLSDLVEVFVEPSMMVTANSAVFAHIGYSEGELAASGTNVANKTLSLDGYTLSGGLKVITDGNVYIKAEAGMTEYDGFVLTGITGVNDNATAKATADTTVAFGALTVGYKF